MSWREVSHVAFTGWRYALLFISFRWTVVILDGDGDPWMSRAGDGDLVTGDLLALFMVPSR